MIARTIVRSLKGVLSVVGMRLIVGGTLFGAYAASQFELPVVFVSLPTWTAVVLGLLAGFVVSFAGVAILFGVPFIMIQMNEQLERIRREEDPSEISKIPLTPDLF